MTTNVCDTLLNDAYFIRALYEYKTDDIIIAELCLSKFLNHLNEECISISVFDKRVSCDTWKTMVGQCMEFNRTNISMLTMQEEIGLNNILWRRKM